MSLSLACPVGRGKNLGSWCLDAPCGSVCCPMPELWLCRCSGVTEGVSRSAELRHFVYLQKRDLGRRFPENINIPKGLDSGRFLFCKGGTGTHSPHTDCWMSGRHFERFVSFDGFVVLSLAVGVSRRWRLLIPCPAGKALTLSSPEHPEQRAL